MSNALVYWKCGTSLKEVPRPFARLAECGHHVIVVAALLALLWPVTGKAGDPDDSKMCVYRQFKWNVPLKRSVDYVTVTHPYRELSAEEIDTATGCTVCEEDQETIYIPPLKPFKICKHLASVIRENLVQLVHAGEPLYEIIGYRVGRTRGDVDIDGNRTRFSNHSYGIAIDINPGLNGLYHNCVTFGPECRLIRGGPWRPGVPGTLTADSAIVTTMKAAGFRWGGEIDGQQKDFMHFSLSGY